MKVIFAIILTIIASNIYASEKCSKVVSGFEAQDIMYVICKDLSFLSNNEASRLIINIFNQYKGPPDEIRIYFVASSKSVGISNIKGNELVGSYYTHSNELEIWPNSKSNKRVINIK